MKVNGVTGLVAALLIACSFAGCTEDVGECFEDGKRGRDTVVVGGQVQFGGQAIMNRACATGCHQSGVTGEARNGAPAGLDFDLVPVGESAITDSETNREGSTYGVIDAERLAGLRERQRKVFTERNRIWQQVKDGLMPPDGRFERFKTEVMSIFESEEASPCTRGTAFTDTDAKRTQDVLRNWLACQAPIVEAVGGPVTMNGTAGQAGFQYLECSGNEQPMGDGGMGDGGGMMPGGATGLDTLLSGVLDDTGCVTCHPGSARDVPLDLSDLDKAYETLVEDQTMKCDGKPYVKPNDPANSFLVDVISKDSPGCGQLRMPLGGELTASQIKQITDWISAGAPKTSSSARILAPLRGGLDAGVN